MTLDKYVMRGFTSSVGNSSGQWVARSPDSQQSQTFQPNNDGGTSFVLGGGIANSSARGKAAPKHRDNDYLFNATNVLSEGTSGGRTIPSNCIGGGRGDGSGAGLDGQKGIMFVFLIVICCACAFLAISGVSSGHGAKAKRPVHRGNPGAVEQPLQRGQPVWY